MGLVRGLIEQRLQRRLLERRGGGIIQHLLECRVHSLGLANLLHRATVVPRVGGRCNLRAQNEGLDRLDVRKPS